MDKNFREAYKKLNEEQRQAVDTIDGPVLVVAGPGTGKTQLLSTRVANIMLRTDTAPSNILCLTFTDNAARNMRERLESIVGQSAYHVAIHTFHSFGSEIINQFPDYFSGRQLLQPIDELGRYELLREIFEALPHDNPLSTKVGEDFIFLKDAMTAIGWLKQNALTPAELHQIINANKVCMEKVAEVLAETFALSPSPKQLNAYRKLLEALTNIQTDGLFGFSDYASVCAATLAQAIGAVSPNGRYAPPITAWRNAWCQKDAKGRHVFKDSGRALRKMHALANVYQALIGAMAEQGLYDFDDMIVEVVHAIEHSAELRFSLQERYQYVLVDEFQDTNKAQLRMLMALGDNPVFDGRPNIMVVGDDDQAIYAFQGAEASNMAIFAELYRAPKLVTLTKNYRSTPDILKTGFSVAEQITDRLESVLPNIHKELVAEADYPTKILQHSVFPSELAQYEWIAEQIAGYIKKGIEPHAIAVIAPRHRYLERLMPYLGARHLPVAYERRENILDAPIIQQLLTMANLVCAVAGNRQDDADALFGEVLAYDFWGIASETVLDISLACYDQHKHWLAILMKSKDKNVKRLAHWFLELAAREPTEPLEYMLDELMGNLDDGVDATYDDIGLVAKQPSFTSPMRSAYFSEHHYEQTTDAYLALLGQLSTLREHLRRWKPNHTLHLHDLVDFAALHDNAHLQIVDDNPHTQTTNAVQVMTAYKAKGLEFDVVFVVNAQDEVWGPTAKERSPSITLPKNLPLAPASDGDNDKLRLLFVALTRAKFALQVTSYTHNLDNKLSPGLSFIGGNSPDSAAESAPGLQPHYIDKPATARAVEILSTDWSYRFRQVIADKPTLLEPVLNNYKLSVTHLNNFIDITSSGPQYFLLHNLLRFPEAPTPAMAYGDAVHRTLQWVYGELKNTGSLPTTKKIQACFVDLLSRRHLRQADYRRLERRGQASLAIYMKRRGRSFAPTDLVERGFNNEGVVVNEARLSGKIDKLCVSPDRTMEVIDFKTGKPSVSWRSKDVYEQVKLYKYRQQLLFYKLLVENSASYHGKYIVSRGALEFIEPDEQGELADNLDLEFDPTELARFVQLIGAVWRHINSLNFPDISSYPKTLKGIEQFEQDLIDDKI